MKDSHAFFLAPAYGSLYLVYSEIPSVFGRVTKRKPIYC